VPRGLLHVRDPRLWGLDQLMHRNISCVAQCLHWRLGALPCQHGQRYPRVVGQSSNTLPAAPRPSRRVRGLWPTFPIPLHLYWAPGYPWQAVGQVEPEGSPGPRRALPGVWSPPSPSPTLGSPGKQGRRFARPTALNRLERRVALHADKDTASAGGEGSPPLRLLSGRGALFW